jgi:hypothetical protein
MAKVQHNLRQRNGGLSLIFSGMMGWIRNGDRVSWGIVENTRIGYGYVTSWSFDAHFRIRVQFREAVGRLVNHTETDGLIFVFWFNTGAVPWPEMGFQSCLMK